jgi:hypothetical protein
MKMTAAQKTKLDKVFALYNDNAAKQTEESNAAYAKLQELCKAYKVDFDAFLKSKDIEVPSSEKTENATSNSQTTVSTQSRRAFIIDCLKQGVFDKQTLAEAIALKLDKYADLKKNLQAVSGTIYDLRQNYDADLTVCDTTDRIVLKSCKPRRK